MDTSTGTERSQTRLMMIHYTSCILTAAVESDKHKLLFLVANIYYCTLFCHLRQGQGQGQVLGYHMCIKLSPGRKTEFLQQVLSQMH